jgi:hypothetical protein
LNLATTAIAGLLCSVSCARGPGDGQEHPPDRRDPAAPPAPTDSGDTADPYRCDAPLDRPISETIITGAVAYHGIGFHEEGLLVGWDGSRSLVAAPYHDEAAPFVPGLSGVEQIELMPDGDLAIAEAGADRLARVTPEGAVSTITSGVGEIYGLTIGPRGTVFFANDGVYRVDVATGATEAIVALETNLNANVVDLDLDSTRLYIGTLATGIVYAVDLDDDLDAISPPYEVARVGTWHDALRVDACGDLWIADMYSSSLYRVDGDDFTVHPYIQAPQRLFGHGIAWGNGVGGWRTDAIYMPLPYNGNQVKEVVIGVASGASVRTWNGGPITW